MSKPRNNPVSGAAYFFRGLGLIGKPGIRRYVAIPLLINVIIFVVGIYYGWQQIGPLTALVEGYLPGWLDWLSVLLIPLFTVLVLLVLFFGFALIGTIVSAPFNGLLAQAVERHLGGAEADETAGGIGKMIGDMAKSIGSEMGKLVYFLVRAIPILILFLVPGLQLIAPLLWFIFGAWMLAFEYGDFPMANHDLLFKEQRQRLAKRRWLSLGFGGMTMAALMVPLLNLLVIPTAVAGVTAMWVEQLKEA